jgi:exopolysaccharide biosynthesis WecB/TagA/CpsF family protein
MSYRKDSGFYLGNFPKQELRDQRRIGPVIFNVVNKTAAVEDIRNAIDTRSRQIFAFCNMHTFNMAMRRPEFAEALSNATVFNDGLGIDIASLILFGSKFPENLNGTDLTPALLASFNREVAVFLVGSSPGVAADAATVLSAHHPFVQIVGTRHGFFTHAESAALVAEIRAAQTELLVVGMGNPRQELWAAEIAQKSGAVVLCVGAFIDFAAGRVARAPRWIRQMRCEWIYRMVLEPSRLWRRYIGGACPFLYTVILERFKRSRVDG